MSVFYIPPKTSREQITTKMRLDVPPLTIHSKFKIIGHFVAIFDNIYMDKNPRLVL
jgi:hypothetical protein